MVTIRPIVAGDYAAVRQLWDAAGLSARPHGRDAQPEFLRQLAAFPTSYLLAECDGHVVGVICGTHDLRRGWLNRIAVHPDSQGQGIGTRLLAEATRYFQRAGARRITLNTQEENESAKRLYRRFGFHSLGREAIALWMDL